MAKAGGSIRGSTGIRAGGGRGLVSIGGRESGGFARISSPTFTIPRVGINTGNRGELKPQSFAGAKPQELFSRQQSQKFFSMNEVLATAGNGLSGKREAVGKFYRKNIKPPDERRVGRFFDHGKQHVNTPIIDDKKNKLVLAEFTSNIKPEAIVNNVAKPPRSEKIHPAVESAIRSNLVSARKIAKINIEGISFARVAEQAFAYAIVRQGIDTDVIRVVTNEQPSVNTVSNPTNEVAHAGFLQIPQGEAKPEPQTQPDIPNPKNKKDGDGGGDDNNDKKSASQEPNVPQVEFEVDDEAAEERKNTWMKIGEYLLNKVPRIEVTTQLLAKVIPDNTKYPKHTSQELLSSVKKSETIVPKDGSVTGSKDEMENNKGFWGKVTNTFQLKRLIEYTVAKHPPTRRTEFVTTRKATPEERQEVWKHVLHTQYYAA